MFRDEFKQRYTTIPFAISKGYSQNVAHEVITHQHREVELIGVTEGSAVFVINSQSYSVKKGDILIIPPYALHRARTAANETTSYYCICFDLNLLCDRSLQEKLETQGTCSNCLIDSRSDTSDLLQRYIEDAFLACEQQEKGWEMTATGNMALLFGHLKRIDFFTPSSKTEKNSNFGKRAFTYIINHYASGTSSRDAAKELYLDHSFFCRSFKKNFGCCFTDYVLAYRLEKAKEYLRSTNLSVTEIALNVGFNDCSYFCKVFKKGMGVSALDYRKNNAE
jgi:YesN/AraC family two-component response regulator